MLTLYDTRLPDVFPLPGSKWIFALKKTTKEYRIVQLGKEVEKYKFLNDQTVYGLFRFGHGALCLHWPSEQEPAYLHKAPESAIEDLTAVQRVLPRLTKGELKPDEQTLTLINETLENLKTEVAKSIFQKILSNKTAQTPK